MLRNGFFCSAAVERCEGALQGGTNQMRIFKPGILAWTVGLIAALTMGAAALTGTDSYYYDALGRLTKVIFADGSSITYAYDSAGNRTTLTQLAAP